MFHVHSMALVLAALAQPLCGGQLVAALAHLHGGSASPPANVSQAAPPESVPPESAPPESAPPEVASALATAVASASATSAVVRIPQEELDARFGNLESNFRAQRTALNLAGVPLSIETEPVWLRAQYRPAMEELARWGSARASAWLLRHFSADADEERTTVLERKAEHYRQVLQRHAGAEWIDSAEIDVLASLLLDAPLLGARLTREFTDAVLEANPGRYQRRTAALRACARAILGVGEASSTQRELAAELWRGEMEAAAETSPFARYASNELWRLEKFWIGDVAPGFVAADVDGNELGIRDFRHKVLVVAFFKLGSRADLAWVVKLRDLAQANEHQHFALLGVELGTGESAFRRLWEENELRFPCVYETSEPGRVASAWRLNEAPRSLVFDGSGRLRFVDLDGAALESTVETLLQEPGAHSPGANGRLQTRR
jgi:peroxiredoxin